MHTEGFVVSHYRIRLVLPYQKMRDVTIYVNAITALRAACKKHVDIILGNFDPPPPSMWTLLLNSYY